MGLSGKRVPKAELKGHQSLIKSIFETGLSGYVQYIEGVSICVREPNPRIMHRIMHDRKFKLLLVMNV